uniref:Uncharacterized protein n=1 Tax=Physcomitrium patens TaxID=3218 RepID=A0A2K1L6U2_PHYPA|nr:hypothetical protein PHYPA_000179 [Physcomitrium patens]
MDICFTYNVLNQNLALTIKTKCQKTDLISKSRYKIHQSKCHCLLGLSQLKL